MNKTAKKSKAKKSKEPQTDQPTKLNSYLLFCRAFRESKKQAFQTLNMMGINEKLRQHWHSLSPEEKAAYKTSQGSSTSPSVATSSPATVANSTNTLSSSSTSELVRGQTTIHLCQECGRMFYSKEILEAHKREEHVILISEAEGVDRRDDVEITATGGDEVEPNVAGAEQLVANDEHIDDSDQTRDKVKYFHNFFAYFKILIFRLCNGSK